MKEYDPTVRHVRLLHGHTSAETAYLVRDYPHGFRLKVNARFWIEAGVKGPARGRRRFTKQTTDPRKNNEVWLKPTSGTYTDLAWMYLDHDDHVQWTGVGAHVTPEQDARLRLSGIYSQMDETDRRAYDFMRAVARKSYIDPWDEWEILLHHVRTYHKEHGELPAMKNSVIEINGKPRYVSDWPTVVAEICGPEKFRVDVLAVGEHNWAADALRFNTIDEAKKYGRILSSQWMKVDRMSVVPESVPEGEPYVEGERKVVP